MTPINPLILFLADLHIHDRKEYSSQDGDLGSRLLEGISIIEQTARVVKDYRIPAVVIAGDIFQLKDRVPSHVLVLFAEALAKIDAYKVILLGNHDYKLKQYSNLKLLHLGDMADLVDRPKVLIMGGKHVGFIPFYRKFHDFKMAWDRLHKSPQLDVVVFHQELPGTIYRGEQYFFDKTTEVEFRPGTLYLSGHLHCHAVAFDRVYYLGSPYQTSFGEAGETKWVWFYYPDGSLSPYKLDYPEFKVFDVDVPVRDSDIRGNYIKVKGMVPKDRIATLTRQIRETAERAGAKAIVLDIKAHREVKRRIKADTKSPKQVIREYVEQTSKSLVQHLDKKKLITVGERLYGM